MRRRRLLGAVAAGLASATAGCGYAYGGGDVRDTASFGTQGFPASDRYVATQGRLVAVANSGRQWIHDPGQEPTYEDATDVTVSTREGDRRWSYTHPATAADIALGDLAYLLDDAGRVVAVDAERVDAEAAGAGRGPRYEPAEAWRVSLGETATRIAAGDAGAYVATEGTLSAVRDGAVAWTREFPAVDSVDVTGDAVVVATESATVALGHGGDERWRIDRRAAAASAGGRTALRIDDQSGVDDLEVRRTTTGEPLWSATVSGHGPPTITDRAVYVEDGGDTTAFDAETGRRLWTATDVEPPRSLVGAPEGVYGLRPDCVAVAVDGDGVRWTRSLEVDRGCEVLAGWLDGETVGFCFESGDVIWLQRTDQDRGLL